MTQQQPHVVVDPPDEQGGRRVRIDGQLAGTAYSLGHVAGLLRRAGWLVAGSWPPVEWRGGGADVWPSRPLPSVLRRRSRAVDTDEPITGTFSSADRVPLLTLDEARQLVDLLLHFEDDSEEGRAAGQLAADLARRVLNGFRWTQANGRKWPHLSNG
ncbi:hypothetical protein [Streptomyces sp. NPDC057854]|uniref:hypothetical protein n=1 Tax=unclassified Streptomyces TaxID=2593676 RepID=UPI0036B980C6